VAKRECHRLALCKAATSGEACFFIGTDTAPHDRKKKEAMCCSAGIFGGATALQTYVEVFDAAGALGRFEAFASLNGPRFYDLPLNSGTITLIKRQSHVAPSLAVDGDEVVVFRGDEPLAWSIGEVKP
jgi:dihydroorotase